MAPSASGTMSPAKTMAFVVEGPIEAVPIAELSVIVKRNVPTSASVR